MITINKETGAIDRDGEVIARLDGKRVVSKEALHYKTKESIIEEAKNEDLEFVVEEAPPGTTQVGATPPAPLAPDAPLTQREQELATRLKELAATAPKGAPNAGDKDPVVVEFYRKNLTKDQFEMHYLGRKSAAVEELNKKSDEEKK